MKPRKTLLIAKFLIVFGALGFLGGLYFLNQFLKEDELVEVTPDEVILNEIEIVQTEQEGVVDLRLPSESTGSADGTLAVRLYLSDESRYPDGAPAVVWGGGGFEVKGIDHDLKNLPLDFVMATFIYPGGEDEWSGLSSDGVYDWRGKTDLRAFRDVVLFTAGELSDSEGKFIYDYASYPVLSDNIGLIGVSNGGNTIAAVAAMFGEELNGHLRYLVQWETPVSSQLAARDFGRVWMKPSLRQGEYFNPRYEGFDQYEFEVDFSDLTYDSTQEYYQVFHDGNGDGKYNTILMEGDVESPDVNGDGEEILFARGD
ncbi:hypothetical protein HOM98_00050 [Candidatus Peregrinibacteria bacterium]|jgi:hypothetical protein|nr:hypothetical protein [Candidatus Peregrinibacteria bacterium]MBT7483983.1 hypothetical protein [Candidatus Peregrinibacteria bacterium]